MRELDLSKATHGKKEKKMNCSMCRILFANSELSLSWAEIKPIQPPTIDAKLPCSHKLQKYVAAIKI